MAATHYSNLRVAENAPAEVIRAAYKALAVQFHPDNNPGEPRALAVMQILNAAYDVLADPEKRKKYDEGLRLSRAAVPHPTPETPAPAPPSQTQPDTTTGPMANLMGFWECMNELRPLFYAIPFVLFFGFIFWPKTTKSVSRLQSEAVPIPVAPSQSQDVGATSGAAVRSTASVLDPVVQSDRDIRPPQHFQIKIPVYEFPEEALPNTGYRGLSTLAMVDEQQAPLKFSVADSGQHFWIKAQQVGGYGHYAYIFVRSGETAEIKVSLGSYTITYASGVTWRGALGIFGTNTQYFRCEGDFDFTRSGNTLHGHRLELRPQRNGNLETEPIEASEF